MGLNYLQSHITQTVENTVESVDLLKISQGARGKTRGDSYKLVVDGECCLDRLYGGYFPDWVCGGQWNKMEQFLRNFITVLQSNNLEMVIYFNGSLEPDRIHSQWKKSQEETHGFIEEITRHVSLKRKPPPKIWWTPPAYLRTAVRLTLRTLQTKTMCTLEDHHKEIIRFCQRNNFHGIVVDDPEYLIYFDKIPRHFSAQKLKLTFKGSLETVELKLKKVVETLELPANKFNIFAALLGNHLISEHDLKLLYTSIDADVTSKDSIIEKVGKFVKAADSTDVDKLLAKISEVIKTDDVKTKKEFMEKVSKCLRYFSDLNIPKPGSTVKDKKNKTKASKKTDPQSQLLKSQSEVVNHANESSNDFTTLPSDSQHLELQGDATKIFSEDTEPQTGEATNGEAGKSTIKTNIEKLMYRVNPEIENVCVNRHKSGLMSPLIYQIFKHKEIKLPAIIQNSKDCTELPKAHKLFRPLRQRVYAILFNLHHLKFLAKQRKESVPPIIVREYFYCPVSKSVKSEDVQAVEIGWGVPTVERLWLGDKDDCKRKRTRAFFTVLKSDTQIVLDNTYVPQQMLVLVCVLRYILAADKVIRKNELEAFIAQAFIQDMTDPSIAQDIEVSNLTMRGVHLAHLFMEGVEMAMLTNDACGAPLPYVLFCPWLFFNGKVFNYVLEQQSLGKSLAEICGYKMDLVYNIDQLRIACEEGLKLQYAPPPPNAGFLHNGPLINNLMGPSRVPLLHSQIPSQGPLLSQLAAAAAANNRGKLYGLSGQSSVYGNGSANVGIQSLYGNYGAVVPNRVPVYPDIPQLRHRKPPPRSGGGQLEVAGMVVGSWGANSNYNPGLNLANSVSAGRNPRVHGRPPTSYVNGVEINSLFDQMRLSNQKNMNTRAYGLSQLSWQPKKAATKISNKKQNSRKEPYTKTSNITSNAKTNTKSQKQDVKENSEQKRQENGNPIGTSTESTVVGKQNTSSPEK